MFRPLAQRNFWFKDHGGLTGLSDDDHPQYHNDVRGDARYFRENEHINFSTGIADAGKPIVLNASGEIDSSMGGGGGVTDHGALTGLGDNDHPQYLLVTNIDDIPVNGETAQPISSNWAFDHEAAADPHTGYRLESANHNHQSSGAEAGQLDHGLALIGLLDDDHTQYHTDARALTWLGTRSTTDLPEGSNLYYTQARFDAAFVDKSIKNLSDVSDSDSPIKNDILKWNGTEFVFVPEGTSFTFSIATFTTNLGSTTVEIGTGTWKAIGAISFSATYNNGPPTDAFVSHATWVGNLTMTGVDFQGPTLNTEAVAYPAVGASRAFTLNATDGTDSPTSTLTYTFVNRRFFGVSIVASGYTEADIEVLPSDLSNTRAKTFTVTAGVGEYIIYSYPFLLQ